MYSQEWLDVTVHYLVLEENAAVGWPPGAVLTLWIRGADRLTAETFATVPAADGWQRWSGAISAVALQSALERGAVEPTEWADWEAPVGLDGFTITADSIPDAVERLIGLDTDSSDR